MKRHRPTDAIMAASAETSLYRAILSLSSTDECQSFFHDLCTPAERQALADRWAVVPLLQEGLSYREIHTRTGVSLTTIGRVARFLLEGHGGYRLAVSRSHPERRRG
jgi:TrpR-related protein YerC/YecD